jgi:hypothetical protein
MAADAPTAASAPEPAGGSGPSPQREVRERVKLMVPAPVAVPVPAVPALMQPAARLGAVPALVQPAARLIAARVATPRGRDDELDAAEADPEARHAGGEVAGAGAAGTSPPPPGSLGPRVQRTSLPELFLMMATRDPPDGGLLVDDDMETLTGGQMRKRDFLRELRAEVTSAADTELRRVGRTAADCPFIQEMLDRHERRTAAEVERSVRRYAPSARGARDARQYLPAVGQRVAESVRRWAETGRVPDDLISEDMLSLRTAGGWVGAVASIAGLQGPEPRSGTAATPPPRRKALGPSPGRVDGDALVAQLGPGRPLDGATRARMEAGFGHSFANVRIHADATAAELNRDLAARAFTVGAHVAMGAGAPAPGSLEGDALLAHELAHVVQQGPATPRGDLPIGEPFDSHEEDADRAAEAVVENLHRPRARRRTVGPGRSGGGLRLQRCGPSYRPRTPADLATAIPRVAEIRRSFGVVLTEEGAHWSPEEVDAVHEGLGLLSRVERDAIGPGLSLVRVVSIPTRVGGVEPHALTSTGAQLVNGTPTRVKKVEFGNQFTGQHSSMVRVVVHELGHLIDSARAHDTRVASMRATAAIEPARVAVNATRSPFAGIWNAAAGAGGTVTRYTRPQVVAFSACLDAIELAVEAYLAMWETANQAAIATVIRDQPAREQALVTALADRDREWAALPISSPGHPAITDFRPVIDGLDAAVAAVRAYAAARIAQAQAAQAHAATVTGVDPDERSNRLVEFERVVDANGYGPLRWPDGPPEARDSYTGLVLRHQGRASFLREMFADAFSMWRTEREALRDQAPLLVSFFDNGRHLQ